MNDTDGDRMSGYGRRRDLAPGRGTATPRLRSVSTPPAQRDGMPDRSPGCGPVPPPADPFTDPLGDPLGGSLGGILGTAGEILGTAGAVPRGGRVGGPRPAPGLHLVGAPERPRCRPDQGLFDPDSITWRVHCDPLMGLAGLRALLLQALHPMTMAAVDAHHRSHWDPWLRLARTSGYVGVTTYGTAAQAMLAGSRLRAVHARIYGITRAGRRYTAEDPNLLTWVHACLVASFLEIVTRGGLSLTPAEQDGYIAEQVRAAALVGLEPHEVPHDRASLVAYFRRLRPALAVTPPAQAAAWSVVSGEEPLREPGAPVPDRPAWASVAGLAFATLPPWGRRLYALPEVPGSAGLGDAAATVALRELRASLQGARTADGCAPAPRCGDDRPE